MRWLPFDGNGDDVAIFAGSDVLFCRDSPVDRKIPGSRAALDGSSACAIAPNFRIRSIYIQIVQQRVLFKGHFSGSEVAGGILPGVECNDKRYRR